MGQPSDHEEALLQSVALQNATSILRARQRAEQELLDAKQDLGRSNERMTRILESITDGFAVVDAEWRFVYLNRKAEEILRPLHAGRESLVGADLLADLPQVADSAFGTAYRRAMAERVTVELEAYYPPLASWFEVRAYPTNDGLSIFFQDVTRRKDAEARLSSERVVLELIATGAPLPLVLERIVREAEAQSNTGMICSVLLLDESGERLVRGAAPSLSDRYNAGVDALPLGARSGSCGTAAFERRTVCVSDIAADPVWEDYRVLAAEEGLRACCSTPVLSSHGAVLGTIAIYYREARSPDARDEQIVALAAHLASIVIERTQGEEALRNREERLRATFDQAAVGIAIADLDGRFLEMNRKFSDILGYSPDELRQLTFREITYPADRSTTNEAADQLLAGLIGEYALEKRYVRRDGSTIWTLATVTMLRDSEGRGRRFIGVVEDISKRKATEEALHRSEQFSRSVIAGSRDCIKTLTLDGKLTWISEAGQKALCITDVSSVIGTSWVDFWHGADRDQAKSALATAAGGGSSAFVGEFAVQGESRWWEVVVTPIPDAQGGAERLLAVSRDVTERVRAERRLRDSEAQLRMLADSIPQLAWMAEPDGAIFWYNRGWYEYTGTTLEQMQGWGWKSVHDPEVLPRVLERWQQSLDTGEPFDMEFPIRGADGAFRWFLTRVNPMRDHAGTVVRWFGTNTDVEEVKRVQQALEEETRLLELLNQTGTSLASKLDQDTLLQTITDAATKLSGAQFGAFFYNMVDEQGGAYMLYTLSGAPRSAFEGFGHPRATPLFGPTFRGEGVIRSDDVMADPRYGQMGPHHGMPPGHPPVRSYLAVPVQARSGDVIGGLFFGHSDKGVFTERTERLIVGIAAQASAAVDNARLYAAAQKSAEERQELLESERHARTAAERASSLKDDFLATLSHELRTPLNAILGWANILRSGKTGPAEEKKGLDIIERNARMQARLIDDLLDMSRITSGKVRLDIQPLQPLTFVEAAIETVRPAAEAKGIRVDAVLDPAAGPMYGDASRLQQVVWNLLSNAIKFTQRDGRVQVVLERVSSHLEISVSDTGTGIDPAFLDHVFDRFRQADASTTRQYGGLGLGLAIVKQLVEMHGGGVRVDSAGIGQGSTFTVHFPLAAIHAAQGTEGPVHPRNQPPASHDFEIADLSGLRIVVVDDEPDARALVARVLGECHAEVFLAADAAEALALVSRERPDILLSDIGMPQTDGYELLRRVRALGVEGGGQVAAIALTAFARTEDRTRALKQGFRAHIAKPVEPSELIATVASVAGRV